MLYAGESPTGVLGGLNSSLRTVLIRHPYPLPTGNPENPPAKIIHPEPPALLRLTLQLLLLPLIILTLRPLHVPPPILPATITPHPRANQLPLLLHPLRKVHGGE